MSCRSTPSGRFSVDFLKNLYPFTDGQSMSIFHKLLKDYSDSEVDADTLGITYRRSFSDFIEQIGNSHSLVESKKQRLLGKLNELQMNVPDNKHKYAISKLIRSADMSNSLINTHLSVAHRYQDRLSESQVKQNYIDLLKEFSKNRPIILVNSDLLPPLIAGNGIPGDKATQYALAAISAGARCSLCGRFIGLSSIHTCPAESAAQTDTSSTISGVIYDEEPNIAEAPIISPYLPVDYNLTKINSEPVIPMSMEEFQDRYDTAKALLLAGAPVPRIPYSSEGDITSGLSRRNGGNTFGIELEVDFPNEYPSNSYDSAIDLDDGYDDDYDREYSFVQRNLLARAIYLDGASLSPTIQKWHHVGDSSRPGGEYNDNINGWICEYDRTVDEYNGERGVEIKSQILYDEPKTWENIRKITENMQQHGAAPTSRTGMHINIGGAGFSNTNPGAHNGLLRLAEAYDDTLIRLAHNPASGSLHRGRRFCSPATVPPEGYQNISGARLYSNHYQAFNLAHLPSDGELHKRSSRVEVRFWDSAVDLGRIQSAVAISAALVELGIREQEAGQDKELAGSHVSRFGKSKLEGEVWEAATLSFRNFISLMEIAGLKSEAHKQSFFYLFAESRWNRG